jgi:hypothetical protein
MRQVFYLASNQTALYAYYLLAPQLHSEFLSLFDLVNFEKKIVFFLVSQELLYKPRRER